MNHLSRSSIGIRDLHRLCIFQVAIAGTYSNLLSMLSIVLCSWFSSVNAVSASLNTCSIYDFNAMKYGDENMH